MVMEEVWKPTTNKDYEISNFGRVRSLKFGKVKIILNTNHFDFLPQKQTKKINWLLNEYSEFKNEIESLANCS